MIKKGVLRIGTSGIAVPGSKPSFPMEFQDKSRLNYYSSLFNTLEVNSTFKKIPMESTLQKWSQEVGEEFKFTIKLWKEITHVKKLNIILNNIDTFINAINHIGHKKACLLIQFPGSITNEYNDEVEQILRRLHELDLENEWDKAVEFRSVTWYHSTTTMLLHQYNACMVFHDFKKSTNFEVDAGATFCYFRFHGPVSDYRGSYSFEFLEERAEQIAELLTRGKNVYAYFNNTMGSAFDNAISLKNCLKSRGW